MADSGSGQPRPNQMPFLHRCERCHSTCKGAGRCDAGEWDGKGDEEDHEPCDLVGLGMWHDETSLDNKAADRVRRLYEGYRRNPYPQPRGHGDSGQNLRQANDDQHEVRDAVEPCSEIAFRPRPSRHVAVEHVRHTSQGVEDQEGGRERRRRQQRDAEDDAAKCERVRQGASFSPAA